MDASEIHARRLNAKEVLTPMKGDNFIFPVADGTVKTTGGDRRLHHVEPRVKLYMPKEESFPIPMKYIDVTRTTHTSLDVLLEKTH